MTGVRQPRAAWRRAGGHAGNPPDADSGLTLDAVCQAASDLLRSLPDRPERLRVCAADVMVDLDWRVSVAPLAPPGSTGGTQDSWPVQGSGGTASSAGVARATSGMVSQPDGGSPDGHQELLHYICAPSVGTFYCAPEPGAAPFAAEGDTVNSGQQVAIIEAMKLMLPVEADRAGRVVQVLAEDGRAVEYGERLFALAPAGIQ